jgi:Tfp pilus assembly protein FimT
MELSLVLVIIAILGAIAAPRYSRSLSRYRAEMAARRVAADLNLASARARNQSTSQQITISGNTYQITGMADMEKPSTTYSINLATEPYRVTLSTTLTTINFDMFGKPDVGGTFTLSIGDQSKSVSLDADSGVASIQ